MSELVSLDHLNELKSSFCNALSDLGTEWKTEKRSLFDKTLNALLVDAFLYHATKTNASFVPVARPEFEAILNTPTEVKNFFAFYKKDGLLANSIRCRSGLYATPLKPNPNPDAPEFYVQEYNALNTAYEDTHRLVRDAIITSSLSWDQKTMVSRILNKKIGAGRDFLDRYLDIIAPETEQKLSDYPTLGGLVIKAQESFETQKQIKEEKEQALKDLGPVLGSLWSMVRSNIR